MKIKKWKAGRVAKAGVIQVKLRKSGNGVSLEVVDTDGDRVECGTALTITDKGVERIGYFECNGIALDSSTRIALVD